jgi:hypothetical protein
LQAHVAVRILLIVTVLALLAPAFARAGTYDVVTCESGGGLYANLAWVPAGSPAGDGRFVTDSTCAAARDPLGVALAPGNAYPAGSAAALRFDAPPGTTIADYELRLVAQWAAAPSTTTDEVVTLGNAVILGAGQWSPAVQAALNDEGRWLGYLGDFGPEPVRDVPVTKLTLTRGASPIALAVGAATSMSIQAGCWPGARTPCSLGPTAQVGLQLTGARVTIDDPSPPALALRAGEGLLAPGARTGAEAVGFAATDNTGIRRAELVDVTDPARPRVIGEQPGLCDFRRPLPCQSLPAGAVAPASQLVGRHTLLVRVSDAAGNVVTSAPFAIAARGPGNGLRASDGARLSAGFRTTVVRRVRGKRRRVSVLRPTASVGFGAEPTVRGTLRTPAGASIAGAVLRLRTRDARRGAAFASAGSVRTRKDGSFVAPLPAGASRTVQLSYRAFAGDEGPGLVRTVRLAVRAGLSVAAPVKVAPRRTATFRGRLLARPVPARSVRLDLQAAGAKGAWRTLRTTTAGANGRFALATRTPGTARPAYRVRARPGAAYPYANAVSRILRVPVG